MLATSFTPTIFVFVNPIRMRLSVLTHHSRQTTHVAFSKMVEVAALLPRTDPAADSVLQLYSAIRVVQGIVPVELTMEHNRCRRTKCRTGSVRINEVIGSVKENTLRNSQTRNVIDENSTSTNKA